MNKDGGKQNNKNAGANKLLAPLTVFLWIVSILMGIELLTGAAKKFGDKLDIRFLTSLHTYCVFLGKNVAIAFAIFSLVLFVYAISKRKLRAAIRESMTIEEDFAALKVETNRQIEIYNDWFDKSTSEMNDSVSEIKIVQAKLSERIHLNAKTHAAHEKVLLIKTSRCNACMNSIAGNTDLEYRVRGLAEEVQTMLAELQAVDD